MTVDEAADKWAREKAILMAGVAPLPLDQKRDLIRRAADYKSGSDSCNSVYMGSLATHTMMLALGADPKSWDLEAPLAKAGPTQIDKALDVCASIIWYMQKHPTTKCSQCGQVVPVKEAV